MQSPVSIAKQPGIGSDQFNAAMSLSAFGGRVIEVLICVLALLFLAPLMLIVAALVYVTDPGPILFGHARIGFGGRTFRCWKFRSMRVDAEASLRQILDSDPAARAEWLRDHKLRNDSRATRIGGLLRRSSLDELPQLFNVLRGDMSLVGPRPIVHTEVCRYGRYFKDYIRIRPGITGLWQVSGRNTLSYRRRVALDVVYARSRSLRLDLIILMLTIPTVVSARGCY